MAGVPFIFGNATTSIPLTNLDANFNTGLTIGNTTVGLGNTVTTLGNVTLTNATLPGATGITQIANGTSNVVISSSGGNVNVSTNGTQAIIVDTSQNVGIGTTAPATGLEVSNANLGTALFTNPTTSGATVGGGIGFKVYNGTSVAQNGSIFATSSTWSYGTYSANQLNVSANGAGGVRIATATAPITFHTGDASNAGLSAERMRIDSSGNLLVGNTAAPTPASKAYIFNAGGSSENCLYLQNNANFAGVQGAYIYNGNVFNDTGHQFLYCTDGTLRAEIRSNGGLANYSANNVNLSDERTKTDIVNAGNYLDKICAIPVRTFLYKDQTDTQLNLGIIAQEVEAVAPELVDISGFGETPEDGIPLKAIYQTDLQYALMKCIQEQQALITTLQEQVTALQAKVGV